MRASFLYWQIRDVRDFGGYVEAILSAPGALAETFKRRRKEKRDGLDPFFDQLVGFVCGVVVAIVFALAQPFLRLLPARANDVLLRWLIIPVAVGVTLIPTVFALACIGLAPLVGVLELLIPGF